MLCKLTDIWSWLRDGVKGQSFVLIALTFLLIFCFILFGEKQTKKKSRSLPGPRGLPLVGYLPFLGSDLRWTFKDLATIYGPIFKVRLGLIDCIVVNSPSHAKEILKDQDVIFANRNHTVAGKLATFGALDIAFNDYGLEWRKLKKIFVSEMLSSANFDVSYNLRKRHVKKMITKTYRRAGELVDIGDLIFFTIFNSVMSMVWGDTIKGKDGEDIQSFATDFRSLIGDFMLLLGTPNVSDFLPFLACLDLQGIRRRMKSVADRIEMLFDLAIDNHFASNANTQKDILGYLLELTKLKDPAKSLSVPQVKAILLDAIVGGMDTTATTAEWVMAELLRHPKIMKIVQAELAETVGLTDTVEEVHIPKLKYLTAVLKETLRLHPPVALLVPHRSSKATTVGGYSVQKDSMVFINTWAIHRDPELWEDPLEFRPERFLSSSENFDFSGNQHKYLPFGSGRRMCPGVSLADKMAISVLSSMLHCFEWKLPTGNVDFDMSETFGFVVKKSKPTMAVPSPRLSKTELYLDE
ncbi:cytochrome P450 71AU50-like [Silene latifolia]|uniref:cytochrome P450 71AU50-like n=1 Tax=Silene latifolia TaxID=37657 RepID=UPI003D784BF9